MSDSKKTKQDKKDVGRYTADILSGKERVAVVGEPIKIWWLVITATVAPALPPKTGVFVHRLCTSSEAEAMDMAKRDLLDRRKRLAIGIAAQHAIPLASMLDGGFVMRGTVTGK